MNILIVGSNKPGKNVTAYNNTHLGQIKKIVPSAKITVSEQKTDIKKALPDAEIIISSPFFQDLLDIKLAKKLRWIHFTSAGVTDIAKILQGKDILLTNSSGVHPIPISEHVATYMLMFARQMHKSYRNQIEKKKWVRDLSELQVFELRGSTVGIIGYGRIGSRVGEVAIALGAKVAAFERKKGRTVGEILKVADFVVNCLPLTSDTRGYFDIKKFQAMKRSAYFINIGRGGTVVEHDLIQVLKDRTIAGAGLDVFETEPLPADSPLWKLKNVIITPHYSGWTPYYTDRVIDIFCTNLRAFLSDKKMPTLVDKTKGY